MRASGGGIDDLRHVDLQLEGAAAGPQLGQLAGGEIHVRADDDEAAGGEFPVGPRGLDFLGGERGVNLLSDPRADEGRPNPVNEARAGPLRADERQGKLAQVFLLDGVHDDRPGVARRGQQGDRAVEVGAQSLNVEHEHVGGGHGPARFLLDPFGQVRRRVSEGRVARELGLAHGQIALLRISCVVRAMDGDPPGVAEGGDHHYAVGAGSRRRSQAFGDRVRLQREVAAQSRVRTGDEGDVGTACLGRFDRRGHGLPVDAFGVLGAERARIGHDVHGRGARFESPGEIAGLPRRQNGKAGHRLGPGGVVVEDHVHGPHPARFLRPDDVARRNRGNRREAAEQSIA